MLQPTKFYPPVMDGIESVAFELTASLNWHGTPTDVLCANVERRTRTDTFVAGYCVTRVSYQGKLQSTSIASAMLCNAGRCARSVDVVHVHLLDPLINLALRQHPPRARLMAYFVLTALSTSANLLITFFVGLVVSMKAFPAANRPRVTRRHPVARSQVADATNT